MENKTSPAWSGLHLVWHSKKEGAFGWESRAQPLVDVRSNNNDDDTTIDSSTDKNTGTFSSIVCPAAQCFWSWVRYIWSPLSSAS